MRFLKVLFRSRDTDDTRNDVVAARIKAAAEGAKSAATALQDTIHDVLAHSDKLRDEARKRAGLHDDTQ